MERDGVVEGEGRCGGREEEWMIASPPTATAGAEVEETLVGGEAFLTAQTSERLCWRTPREQEPRACLQVPIQCSRHEDVRP